MPGYASVSRPSSPFPVLVAMSSSYQAPCSPPQLFLKQQQLSLSTPWSNLNCVLARRTGLGNLALALSALPSRCQPVHVLRAVWRRGWDRQLAGHLMWGCNPFQQVQLGRQLANLVKLLASCSLAGRDDTLSLFVLCARSTSGENVPGS